MVQKSHTEKVNDDKPVKSASKPSKSDEIQSIGAKTKRKSLPANIPSAKKAKLKRHSMGNLKSSNGFIEEDI